MTKTQNGASSLSRGILIAALATTSGLHAQEDDSEDLEEITIRGEAIDNRTGSRLGLTDMETPATVEVIDGDTIRERLDTSILEAVTRSAGFTNDAHHAEGGQDVAARGFHTQGTVTKLFDGTNYYNAWNTISFPFDTWGVERIEVLKGPSSVLYGEGGIGGAYNVIPKAAQQERSGDMRVSIGEENTRLVGIGLTGGLTDDVAYRLDYSNHRSDNWVDRGDSETGMLSASLLWQVTGDFSLTARYDQGDQEPMRYSGTPLVNGDFASELLTSNYDVSDAIIRHKDNATRIRADWNASGRLSMQSELYRMASDRYWRTLDWYDYDRAAGTVMRGNPGIFAHDVEHDGFRTNFVLDAGHGERKLKTSLGFEINNLTFKRAVNFGRGNPNGQDWVNDRDVVDAFNFNPRRFSDLTSSVARTETISDAAQFAAFAEGQVGLTESLTLVVGLRHEDVETELNDISNPPSFDQNVDALTGRAGLVFDVSDTTALYAQYATGATHPTGSIVRVVRRNREIGFTKTELLEVGIKQSLADDRWHWTVALFDIVKNDLIGDHPDDRDAKIVIPEKTSGGVELSVTFAPTDALKLTANAAFVDVDRTVSGGFWGGDVEAPDKTYNLGLAWAPGDKLQVLADARFVGMRWNPDNAIPAYTVVDASAHWHFNEDLSIALRIDNVFDELYASSPYYLADAWLVGKPRTLNLSVDYSFF